MFFHRNSVRKIVPDKLIVNYIKTKAINNAPLWLIVLSKLDDQRLVLIFIQHKLLFETF